MSMSRSKPAKLGEEPKLRDFLRNHPASDASLTIVQENAEVEALKRCRFVARGDHEHSFAAKLRETDYEKRTAGGKLIDVGCKSAGTSTRKNQKEDRLRLGPKEVLRGAEDARHGFQGAERCAGDAAVAAASGWTSMTLTSGGGRKSQFLRM
ncbi:hypothetical protein K438DRAFT_1775521 [Mycena galopus ATCC 62051]|nr:hypothetical protein K438DRAFT_1775521 [Mycena galopus ATCC 62051]